MKIFVTGGTGYIGQSVVKEALKLGYDVTVLTRSAEKAKELEAQGVNTVVGDMLKDGIWQTEINKTDAIVHLATPPTWESKVTQKAANQFRDNHVKISQALFKAVDPSKVKKIVFIGGSSYYGETGRGEPQTEEYCSPPMGWGPYITPAVDYAKTQKDKFPVVFIFPAQIYGPSSWLEKIFMEPVYKKRIVAGLLGHDPYFSPIHIEDCGRACLHLIEHGVNGEDYILSDHKQIPMSEFRKEVHRLLGVPNKMVFSVPQFVATLVVGPVVSEYATVNTNLSSQKLRDTGFKFNYPTYTDGLPSVVSDWLKIKKQQNESFFKRYLT